MIKKNKIWMGWLAFLFLVFHFTLIFIYAFPEGVFPNKLKEVSAFYVSPLYEQKWNMFAPCPIKSYEAKIKYSFEDGSESDWIKPTKSAKEWHSMLRFTHHAEIVLIEPILLFWVDSDVHELELQFNKTLSPDENETFKKGATYWMLRRYVYGNSEYLFNKRPIEGTLQMFVTNVITSKTDSITLPTYKWSYQ